MKWTRGRTIGRGGSATVSLAASGDAVFAVKSAELTQSGSLQREHQILSNLQFSPRIVTYKGCDISCESNKAMYNLFFEYAAAGTLSDETRRRGGSVKEAAIVPHARQILEGLDFLHSNGLVHCDIKGTNILISETGAKIADFGCARRAGSNDPTTGTPAFMAPEVARGEKQGFAGDVWSFGCTVLEMATGSPPWGAADPAAVLYRVGFSGKAPAVPGWVSGEMRDFLGMCFERDPKQRWTASQLLKHRFLDRFDSTAKRIEEPISESPTSVLDRSFWGTSDEETESARAPASRSWSISDTCSKERIGRLSESEIEPSWRWDENWITVR